MTDPYRILGVRQDADDEKIRAAYLLAIRECPPERDQARFERVRHAYESIRNARQRLAYELFDKSMPSPADVLALLSENFKPERASAYRLRSVLGGK